MFSIYIRKILMRCIEIYYEAKLHSKTNGYMVLNNRYGYSNYEPTSYIMMKKLFGRYPFSNKDHLVDFGCGLGRVIIFSSYMKCPKVTGIENDEKMYTNALKNINNFNKNNINLVKISAEKFTMPNNANKFFFFDPFNLKYFIRVINNIINSLRENFREIYIFLYDTNEYYIKYLNSEKYFKLKEVIYGKSIYKSVESMHVYTISSNLEWEL